MNIHEFGEENTDVIVLFHPLGVRWDVFNYVINTVPRVKAICIRIGVGLKSFNRFERSPQ